jgi:hypothetical protein
MGYRRVKTQLKNIYIYAFLREKDLLDDRLNIRHEGDAISLHRSLGCLWPSKRDKLQDVGFTHDWGNNHHLRKGKAFEFIRHFTQWNIENRARRRSSFV